MLEKKVYVIEPENPIFNSPNNNFTQAKKLRVCAYARVSSDSEDQLNSYNAQIQEFEKRITENDAWEFIGLYADEGISGTGTKKRFEFLRMIDDAKLGKIDLILTKSLSRFARNTVDTLTIVKELREVGVDIFFEKENIYSSDPKVDFMLTIFSSIAQEESRNISENVKWGVQKRYKEGKVHINTNRFLGYDKDKDGKIVINKEQAVTIKIIFDMFLSGETLGSIARFLTENKMKNGRGVVQWHQATVKVILENEKYCGDAILQKRVTVDYLSHKSVPNDGIAPKYYIKDNHEGIVSRNEFNAVQDIIKARKEDRKGYSSNFSAKFPLSGIVFCGHCGNKMNRHHYNYGKPNQRVVLSCKNRGKGKPKNDCKAKPIDNKLLETTIGKSIENSMDMEKIKNEVLTVVENNLSTKSFEDELEETKQSILKLESELKEIMSMDLVSLKDNATFYEELFKTKKNELETLKQQYRSKKEDISNRNVHKDRMIEIKKYIDDTTLISRRIINTSYTYVVVVNSHEVIFVKDGKPIPKQLTSKKLNEILNHKASITKTIEVNKTMINYTVINLEVGNE